MRSKLLTRRGEDRRGLSINRRKHKAPVSWPDPWKLLLQVVGLILISMIIVAVVQRLDLRVQRSQRPTSKGR